MVCLPTIKKTKKTEEKEAVASHPVTVRFENRGAKNTFILFTWKTKVR